MVTLTASGNSVVFTFENSNHYLYGNGEIEVPKDSLILVIDKSDIVTFRKIDGDVFVSFNINDSNFSSKYEIEEFYKENMVGGGGIASGDVQTMIDDAVSGKVDTSVFDTYSAATNTSLDAKANSSWVSENFVLSSTIDAINPVSWNNDVTQSVTSASTIDDIPSAKAVYDAILTGGTSYSAGRGIDITNDTISFNLPISAGTGGGSIIEGNSTSAMSYNDHAEGYRTYVNGNRYAAHAEGYQTSAMTASCHAEGRNTKAAGDASHAEGIATEASGNYSHAEGDSTKAYGSYSHAEGSYTSASSVSNVSGIVPYMGYQARHAEGSYTLANNSSTHAEGYYTVANNFGEHASGVYNASNSASTTWGNSGNTLFSVGNGTSNNSRHNAFEIRQNGDIYINKDGQDIKLQDNLGGEVSSAITSGDTNAVAGGAVYDHLNTVESVIATSLVDLDNRKLDASAYTPTDLSNYYNKAETDSAISAATSGKADSSSVYTYVAADDRITVATAAGNHRKAIGLGVDVYKGSGSRSLSLLSQQGTAQGANDIKGGYSAGIGWGLSTNNLGEVAVGQFNRSVSATTTFGDSGNTLFSVGNGTASSSTQRKNAFEIRQNNDIYVKNENGYTVKLQDYVRYKIVKLTQAEYDALVQGGTVDANTVYFITNSNS